MTERTAVPERVSSRAKSARRGGSGAQTVGDYVGQPAGEAAQAVRRTGLRPGLDRSFGCPPELVGLVVAQDPTAGSELARNGMVTLLVAAPGGEPTDQDAAPSPSGAGEIDARVPDDPAPDGSQRPRRRRRKRGLSRTVSTAARIAAGPLAPASEPDEHLPPERKDAGEAAVEESPHAPVMPIDPVEEDPRSDIGEQEPPAEEFVVQVEDVLAGHSGPSSWQRSYPRRGLSLGGVGRGSRAGRWLARHRVRASVLAAVVGLWAIVAVLSAAHGGRPSTRPPVSALAPSNEVGRGQRTGGMNPAAPGPTASPRPIARSAASVRVRSGTARVSAAKAHRASRARPRTHRVKAAPTRTPATVTVQQPAAGTSPRPTVPAAPASGQSGGGLFSP